MRGVVFAAIALGFALAVLVYEIWGAGVMNTVSGWLVLVSLAWAVLGSFRPPVKGKSDDSETF